MLQLKLQPSSMAARFVFFMVLRFIVIVLVVYTLFFTSPVWFYASLAAWIVLSCMYYMYMYRLLLCILLLAQRAEGEGQPVGRPPLPSEGQV